MAYIPLDPSFYQIDHWCEQNGYHELIEIVHHAEGQDLLPGKGLAECDEQHDVAVYQLRNKGGTRSPEPEMFLTRSFFDLVEYIYIHDLAHQERDQRADDDQVVLTEDRAKSILDIRHALFATAGEPCLVVFKNGAKTDITIGKADNVSSYTRRYFSDTHVESREWPIIPTNKDSGPFSSNGDSGSCVADAFSRVGGILTGGCGATESSDVTYVTPISYIMEVLHKSKHFQHAYLNPIL